MVILSRNGPVRAAEREISPGLGRAEASRVALSGAVVIAVVVGTAIAGRGMPKPLYSSVCRGGVSVRAGILMGRPAVAAVTDAGRAVSFITITDCRPNRSEVRARGGPAASPVLSGRPLAAIAIAISVITATESGVA